MPRGPRVLHVKKAGDFVGGDLLAGELGLDVTTGAIWISRNGSSVEKYSTGSTGAVTLNDLTDVTIASLANGHVLQWDSATSQFVNRTLAGAGILATAQRGVADGVASLGSDGKIPVNQLPALAINDTFVVASQAAQLAQAAQAGDMFIRTDLGVTYVHNGGTSGTMSDYQEIKANDTAIDGAHITSGDITAARMQANLIAAMNAGPGGTISNNAIIIDCGSI